MIDTQALKEKILDVAMSGRLVHRNPNDEPIEELLERIIMKREERIQQKKIKRNKNETQIFCREDGSYYEKFEDEHLRDLQIPFLLPENWGVQRFKALITLVRGSSPRPIKNFIKHEEGVNWIKIGDTEKYSKYIVSTSEKISEEGSRKSRAVFTDELLLSNSMSYGRPYILKIDGFIHDGWFALRYFEEAYDSDFLYLLLSSNIINKQFIVNATGSTVKNISSDIVNSTLMPLPPKEEQLRIVSKVNRLFELVDKIEKEQNQIKILTSQMKGKILDLAMEGKITTNLVNDEIKTMIQKTVCSERTILFEKGKLKKKDLKDSWIIKDEDNFYYEEDSAGRKRKIKLHYERPDHWYLSKISQMTYTIPSRNFQIKKSEIKESGMYPVISQSQNYIEGYSDEVSKVLDVEEPLIIFGDHTRILKKVNEPFIVGADGVKILRPIFSEPEFFMLQIQQMLRFVKDRGYARHYSYLEKEWISTPDLTTQKDIIKKVKLVNKYIDEIIK